MTGADATGDDGLRRKIVTGVSWKLGGQVVQQCTSTAVALVLVRLLSPSDFGIAAMALAFTGLALLLTDVALSATLIQRPSITQADCSTAFWTTLGAGAVVSLAGIALAPLVASFFSTPDVEALFAVAWGGAFISALGMTQSALLTREMDFRGIELRDMAATAASGGLALVLAALGAGAWALVAYSLAFSATSTLLVWRLSPWRPTWEISRESLRRLAPFGLKVSASRLLGYLNLNADNILVGRYLGTTALGSYAVAYNVVYLPTARLTQPIQDVLFAGLSRLQEDPARLGRAWLRGNALIVTVAAPAFLGMAVVAPDFVPVVLGDRWSDAVPVLQLLSLAGIAQALTALNWSAMQAVGQAGALLRFMVFSTALTVAGFVTGLVWGIAGVAGMFAASRFVVAVCFAWLVGRAVAVPLRAFVRAQLPALVLGASMAAVVLVARLGLLETSLPAAARLVVLVALGIAVYAALVMWRAPALVAELRGLRRRVETA